MAPKPQTPKPLTTAQIETLRDLSETRWQMIRQSTAWALQRQGLVESKHVVKSQRLTTHGRETVVCLAWRRTLTGTEFLKSIEQ